MFVCVEDKSNTTGNTTAGKFSLTFQMKWIIVSPSKCNCNARYNMSLEIFLGTPTYDSTGKHSLMWESMHFLLWKDSGKAGSKSYFPQPADSHPTMKVGVLVGVLVPVLLLLPVIIIILLKRKSAETKGEKCTCSIFNEIFYHKHTIQLLFCFVFTVSQTAITQR